MGNLRQTTRARSGPWLRGLIGLAVMLAAVPFGAALAQTGSVVGTVTDRSTAQPLEGVSVLVVGTRLGALTDGRGHYVIRGLKPGADSLRVQRIGFRPSGARAQVPEGDSTVVNFSLDASAVELNQVVTTGTGGAVEKRELGAPIAIVDVASVQDVKPSGEMTQLLEGQVAGIRSVSTGGGVGGAMDLRIRGVSSFTLNQRPGVYIDGVKVDTRATDWSASLGNQGCCNFNGGVAEDRLSDLNPDDIDHIEVLKGAAAATLYGSEASNGVIQIFTKRGKSESAPQWSVEAGTGFDRQRPNYPTKLYPNFTNPTTGVRALDMNKTLIGNGPYGMYNIEVQGGAQNATYYVSGGYTDEVGSLQPNDEKRGNLRANIDWSSGPQWTFDVRSAFDHNFIDALQSGNNWTSMTGNASNGDPRQATLLRPYGEAWVSVADIKRITSYSLANHWTGGITITYQATSNFQNRLTVGSDLVGESKVRYYPPDGNYQSAYISNGEKDDDFRNNTTYTADYLGQVTFHTFGIGNNLSFGGQGYYTTEWLSAAIGKVFAGPGVSTVSSASQTFGGELYTHQVNMGGLVQDRLAFSDRLYTTVGFRVDGNSAFGHNYGFQRYPKIDAAYNLDGYSWLPKAINSLKIRGAVGQAGRAPGPYDSFLTLAPSAVFTNTPALVPASPGNLNLKPEITTEYDAGFDAGLFHDRLGLSMSIYKSGTKDAILPIPLPPSSGFTSSQQQNVGGVETRGWDFSVNWIAIQNSTLELTNDLKLDGSHNRITSIGTATPTTTLRVGYPVGGVWAIAPASYNATTKTWTGTTSNVFFGPPLPTFNLSYSPTVRFGRFQAYVMVTAAQGAAFNNADRPYRFREHTGDQYLALLGPNGADTPAADSIVAYWSKFTDIESRDNVELREISLAWTVPPGLARMLHLGQSTTATLSAHNVMWWDHCACQDPYTNWDGADSFTNSSAFLTDPAPRQFRLTIRSRY